MKMQKLLERWQSLSPSPEARRTVGLELGVHDLARINALAELYPGRTPALLMAELLHVALDELQEALPYVNGSRQVGEDEFGQPLYEDIGPTPRFLTLTQKHLKALEHH
ncbi:MAG: pilin assembly protein [Moraxellaceae bacterium]|nr:pilin assembly protein [Moraxellaceae bacterium]